MWGRIGWHIQHWGSLLVLVMGGLLFFLLVLSLPAIVRGVLAGDVSVFGNLLSILAACGVCWLQWHYRRLLYSCLRNDQRP
jgi:hypothetical protein